MKKKSWSYACSLRCNTRRFRKYKKYIKKLRHKRARLARKGKGRQKDPEMVYKTTGAWDIV